MKTLNKKYMSITALIFALLVYLITPFSNINAYADTFNAVDFSKTSVVDDLKSATESGDLQFWETGVCYFVEYGYSPVIAKRDKYFGLYVYVYNPTGKIITTTANNVVNISYEVNENGQFFNYNNKSLIFCNKSADNKYYKFKIDIAYNDKFLNSKGERHYSIAGVQLFFNNNNAEDFLVGGVYTFTGTAKGFGVDESAESTLKMTKADLETLKLEVQSTYYRPKATNENGNQSQVTSVYFAVPNDILTKYGTLQRIKAEWFEYKTKPIMVADNDDETFGGKTTFDYLLPYVGKTYDEVAHSFPDNMKGFYLYSKLVPSPGLGGFNTYYDYYGPSSIGLLNEKIEKFNLLFGVKDISEYDPLANSLEEIGGISGNELYQYILHNKSNLSGESLDIKDGQILKAYFEDDIDESRKRNDEFGLIQQGYSFYDFDASANLNKITIHNPHDNSWGENISEYGFWGSLYWNLPESTKKNVEPITVLKNDIFKTGLSQAEKNTLVDAYFINPLHFDKIVSDVQKNAMDSKTTFKFNFAVSEYYSKALNFETYNTFSNNHGKLAYVAQESVFFDFDIIQLTFKGETGNLTVIPVVANPIDIIPDITPPVIINDEENWWKVLLALILLCLFLFFIAPVFPQILNILVAIIMFPIKAISGFINSIKTNKKE